MDWQKSFTGWGSASITAVGSVAAAAIVACAAYGAARVFEPSFVRIANATFNLGHIVEIVDTPDGCGVVLSKDGATVDVTGRELSFSSHILDFAGCQSLRRALSSNTLNRKGRLTKGDIIVSAIAQSGLVSATGRCPSDMPVTHVREVNGQVVTMCDLSVGTARRFIQGPPWPESWKSTGLLNLVAKEDCPDTLVFHSSVGDGLSWCCFGLSEGDPHPGHSVR